MAFPGLGRYAALGSIMAARANAVAAQNQSGQGPAYIAPNMPSQFSPLHGPDNALETGTQGTGASHEIKALDKPLEAGQAPEMAKAPGSITLPPMPASSSLRDVQPRNNMASLISNINRKYRSAF